MAKSNGFTHESAVNESIEWYTPPEVFDALGLTFDLDPCSPGAGNSFVPANRHYTIVDDGLASPWFGTVWVNPQKNTEGNYRPCQCGCHQVAPSSAQAAGNSSRATSTISVLAPTDLSGYRHVAGSVYAPPTGAADLQEVDVNAPHASSMGSSGAPGVASESRRIRCTSIDEATWATGSPRGVESASASARESVRRAAGASSPSASETNANGTRGLNAAGSAARAATASTTSGAGNAHRTTLGCGTSSSGRSVSARGQADVPTATLGATSPRTMSSPSVTNGAQAPFPGTSSRLAHPATPASKHGACVTGAQTRHAPTLSSATASPCSACTDDVLARFPLTVWVNPPYGPHTPVWLEKLAEHGDGIALVFSRTDTRWFQQAAAAADAVCFVSSRIKFFKGNTVDRGGSPGAGSVLIAYGEKSVQALHRSGLGLVMQVAPPAQEQAAAA